MTTPEVGPASDDAPPAEAARTPKSRIWGRARGGAVSPLAGVTVVSLILALLLGVALADARGDAGDLRRRESRREAALGAARRFAAALTSYDYRRIADDVRRVAEQTADGRACEKDAQGRPKAGTPCFASEYALAGGTQFQQIVRDNRAVSKGEVVSAGVVGDRDNAVVVLLAVDQTVTNANRPTPRVDRNRIQLTLERRGDRWLVVDVAVL